jgi:hypothetical protein
VLGLCKGKSTVWRTWCQLTDPEDLVNHKICVKYSQTDEEIGTERLPGAVVQVLKPNPLSAVQRLLAEGRLWSDPDTGPCPQNDVKRSICHDKDLRRSFSIRKHVIVSCSLSFHSLRKPQIVLRSFSFRYTPNTNSTPRWLPLRWSRLLFQSTDGRKRHYTELHTEQIDCQRIPRRLQAIEDMTTLVGGLEMPNRRLRFMSLEWASRG